MWRRPRYWTSTRGPTAPPGANRRRGAPGLRGFLGPVQAALAFILMGLVLLSYAFPAQLADLRWPFFLYLLVVLAWILIGYLRREEVESPPLGPRRSASRPPSGELRRVVGLLKRADRGLRFSQVQSLRRVRRAFLVKLGAERGLDEEGVHDLLQRPEALEAVVQDPIILDFLRRTSREELLPPGEAPRRNPVIRLATGSMTRYLRWVVGRMEAWA